MNEQGSSGGVSYKQVGADYFANRGLKRYAKVWSLWALGVGAVISGHYSGWNFGLANGWGSMLVALFIGKLFLCGIAIWIANKVDRIGAGRRLKGTIVTLVLIVSFVVISNHMASMSKEIESTSGWIGGLGLPVLFGWAVAGVVAAIIAWAVGKICLGLRSDYLAIATLGIAAIIKTFLKNADWLTRGTLTVSPLPWPVPTPANGYFFLARFYYLCVVVVIMVLLYLLLQRAYYAPWGRMMRAIRDNEDAAEAMGKDVTRRRLQIFVLVKIADVTGIPSNAEALVQAAVLNAFNGADGEQTTLADFEGRPVLVNLWASWCAPCVKELPTLDRLQAARAKDGSLKVVAISQDMGPHQSVLAFLKAHRIAGLESFQDPKMALSGALNVQVMPTTILFDAQGQEVWRYVGDLDWTGPEAAKLLAEAGGGQPG